MTLLNYLREDIRELKDEVRGKLNSLDTKIEDLGKALVTHTADDTKSFTDLKARLSTEKDLRKTFFEHWAAIAALIISAATALIALITYFHTMPTR